MILFYTVYALAVLVFALQSSHPVWTIIFYAVGVPIWTFIEYPFHRYSQKGMEQGYGPANGF